MTFLRSSFRPKIRARVLAVLLVAFCLIFLAGCESLPGGIPLPWVEPTPTSAPSTQPTPTPEGELPVATQEPTPTDTLPLDVITLWVPPHLNPEDGSPAGLLLREQLNSFGAEFGVEVRTRAKAMDGSSGLLESLSAASAAAPESLPDLIALEQNDLIQAHESDLIFPHPEIAALLDSSDWYRFAKTLSLNEEEIIAVPIYGDPVVMVFDERQQLKPANDWEGIVSNNGRLGFPADDPRGTFLLTLYMAGGGNVQDSEGHILLEEEPLADALRLLIEAWTLRHISTLSLEWQNPTQVWEAYDEWQVNTGIVPSSMLLAALKEERSMVPVPAVTEPAFTLASGWGWAISTPHPQRQALAAELAAYLSRPEFQAQWTETLGLIPARPSALGRWTDTPVKQSLENVTLVAALFPREEVLNRVGPVLRNATILVLRDGGLAGETAREAVESLN